MEEFERGFKSGSFLAIFLMMYAAIIIGKVHRMLPLSSGCLYHLDRFSGNAKKPSYSIRHSKLISDLWRHSFWISTESPFKGGGLSWQTILFIGGMMW
jgi:hypothetical protein